MLDALQHLRTDFRSMMSGKRLNALSLLCIHRDIFFDYDKIIDMDSNIQGEFF